MKKKILYTTSTLNLFVLTLFATNSFASTIDNIDISFGEDKTIENNSYSSYSDEYGAVIYNEGTVTIQDSVFSSNDATKYGGAIYNKGIIVSSNTSFTDNTAYRTDDEGSGGAIYSDSEGELYLTGSFVVGDIISDDNITDADFYNNSARHGGAIFNESLKFEISNVSFANNSAKLGDEHTDGYYSYGGAIHNLGTINSISSSYFYKNTADMGGAIYNYAGYSIEEISNTVFDSNEAIWGGAIHNDTLSSGEVATIDSIVNSTFINNTADIGGAIYNEGTISSISNSSFTGNSASTGGAIYNEGNITLSASDGVNAYYSGNYATNSDTSTTGGGFLFQTSTGSIIFNVDETSSITIGDATTGYDSIAGTGVITKTGDGLLTVNSSMSSYYGTLNVSEGEMAVNNGLGAYSISISESATLSLTIKGDNTLTSSFLGFTSTTWSYSNEGTLKLIASVGIEAGEYAISASKYITDLGYVIAYGGTVEGNTFYVSDANTDLSVDDGNTTAITIENNGILSVTSDDTAAKIVLSFNADSVDVTSVTSVATEDSDFATFVVSNVDESDTLISFEAFYFDISLTSGDSAIVSFLVGEGFDISQFTVYHSENGIDGWEIAEISDLSYEDNYLSFIVNDFSAYGYSIVVPEPSTYAMIFGTLALALAMYRRRK